MPSQTETTKTIDACSVCGHTNAKDRRFCGTCGARLWEPCVGCGQENVVDLQFCGNCGVDLEEAVEREAQRLQSTVHEADKLAETGRFVDALERLQTCSLPGHSDLAEIVSGIKKRVAEFPAQRERAIADARKAHEDALAFVDLQDDRRALARLNQIRPAFRSTEIRDLMGQLESRIGESDRLKKEIRSAVAGKAYDGLLPKVTRLLQLEPSSPKLQKLADQLQQRQAKVDRHRAGRQLTEAEEALAACDYRKARTALSQYPEGVADEGLEKRRREAQERVWLASQMRTAPHVSKTLVEIGRRLVELQPHDQKAAELSAEACRRWAKAAGTSDKPPIIGPTWVEPPAKTILDAAVRLAGAPRCLAEYASREGVAPCKFLVAFGLALQGLGRSAIGSHLTPREQSSWLEKVARLKLTRSQSPQSAWGIDLGADSLKAVHLTVSQPDKKGPLALIVDGAFEVPLRMSTPFTKAAANGDGKSREAEAFEQLQSVREIASDATLVLGLPCVQSPVRLFKLPDAVPERFAEAVHYEVRTCVPLGENELLYGSHRAEKDTAEGDAADTLRSVVAVAASRTHVGERLKHLGESGGASTIVQSNGVALVNACRYAAADKTNTSAAEQQQVTALVDIGAETTNVVVDEGDLFWFRGSYGGLRGLDDALAESLQLTRGQAADLRKRPEAASEMHRVDEILQAGFGGIVRTIERALEQYQRERGRRVERVYLCGGGAYQFGLLRHLWFGGA